MFEPHGTIERCFLITNLEGLSKGYGFVEFSLLSECAKGKTAVLAQSRCALLFLLFFSLFVPLRCWHRDLIQTPLKTGS
jgi:hypothetical protein